MEKHKTCSFFGHRKIEETEDIKKRLQSVIVNLIEKEGVKIFLFGSRSDFDFLCHTIVTELKNTYSNIQRRAYTCRSETCILENERAYWEEIYSRIKKRPVSLLGVEEEIEHKTKWTSGKAQYIERNQAMIDDSNFCVFYYNDKYKPPLRKHCRNSLSTYQPKSGTKLAYEYALRKKKEIINLFE
ncbi:MAG: DUF1273 family protein [Clostridia bacterium]|nr:DUF1273 family protein [Clostridia bacterium]